MTTEEMLEMQQQTEPKSMKALPEGNSHMRVAEICDSIARRAFEVFENRGRRHGHDLEDWLSAESELLHPLHLEITESDDAVTLHVEVPGFTAKELEIGVDAHVLTISGKRETREARKTKRTIFTEHCSNEIYRAIELPPEADPTKIHMSLKDGVLELTLPKLDKK